MAEQEEQVMAKQHLVALGSDELVQETVPLAKPSSKAG